VLRKGNQLIALEVKAGKRPMNLPGISAFDRNYAPQKKLLVGAGGISFEEFLEIPPVDLFF
jgi:hypothetical protein